MHGCCHFASPALLQTFVVQVVLMISTPAMQAGHVLQNLELTSHNPFSNETFSRVTSLLRQATAAI